MVQALRRLTVAALLAGAAIPVGFTISETADAAAPGCSVLERRFNEEQDNYWAALDQDPPNWGAAAEADANATRLMRLMEAAHC